MTIQDIITGINTSHRFGSEVDYPEGARYIVISDTLADQIVLALYEIERQNKELTCNHKQNSTE